MLRQSKRRPRRPCGTLFSPRDCGDVRMASGVVIVFHEEPITALVAKEKRIGVEMSLRARYGARVRERWRIRLQDRAFPPEHRPVLDARVIADQRTRLVRHIARQK